MAGARSTGKSIYIAVMVKQLAQLARHGMTVTPADDATVRNYREHYEGPLYVQRNIMVPTGSSRLQAAYQRAPLVYSVRAPHGGQWFLAIRDVAGEDLEPENAIDGTQLSFFSRADGVMFLFDPLAVPAVRNSLSDAMQPQVSGADPAQVLERTLELMGGPGRRRLAVVLSKFDAVQALGRVERSPLRSTMQNLGAACLRDPGPLTGYDEGDAQLLHEEVRSLLNKLGAEALVGRLQWAEIEHRFFAVSALGEAPIDEALHGRGIAPFRCLDPVKWFLQIGVT